MNEYPLFVPFEDQHLAAVVTVPEVRIRGLAVLLQGLGAPRSHRYGLWTWTARTLADRGIASVRLDYPELGDSTGVARLAMDDTPLPHTVAVIDTVREALGVREFATTGNCLGAKISLELAAGVDGCVSVGCIIPGSPKTVLVGEGRTAPHRAARRVSRRMPRLGSFGRQALRSHKIQPRMHFIPEVADAMRNADLMFLHLGSEERHHRLERALATLATDEQASHRVETWFIPAGNTSGMRLDLDLQPKVIGSLVRWIDETLPGAATTASMGPQRATEVAS